MKKVIVFFGLFLALIVLGFIFLSGKGDVPKDDQSVLQKTLDISKSYTVLRLKTDDILMNARNYQSYEEWQLDMNVVLAEWLDVEREAVELESLASNMLEEKTSLKIINRALAYDKQEISDIFDRAPAGKKIATLAKHLGVDAKRAYAILTQDQAQVQADAWNEAGDTFKKLETAAVAIKNTSKVAVFVGTIAVSGGTAAIAAGSTLAKTAVVVAGADLTLEVTDDAAKIALGDKNKISTIAGSARVVTEPAAAILMISTLPSNLTKAVDKLGAVTFGAEQLNSSVQEGKVIGISLPSAKKSSPAKPGTMSVSVLENSEIEEWLKEEGASQTKESIEEIKVTLEKEVKEVEERVSQEKENEEANKNIDKNVPNDFEGEEKLMLEEYGTQNGKDDEVKGDDAKQVQINFKNDTNITWVLDTTIFGSDEYRDELDAIDADDFAVLPGVRFGSVNMSRKDMLESGSDAFVETSKTTYDYKIQLIAGGTMPEDENEIYVYNPFTAVVDFVVKGTYGKPVTVVWDGSSFRQID